MPGPLGSDLHVDALLTNISVGYKNLEYIADQICPIVQVKKQSDIIPQYDKSHWFRDEAKLRAPGTKSEGGGWTVDVTNLYHCLKYSYRKEIADDDRANADAPFNLDRESTEFVTDKIQLRRERNFASSLFTTGVWTTNKVGDTDFTKWSDYANSSPLTDLTGWIDTVEGLIGREPGTFVMGKQVWSILKWHPDLVDTIKYTQKGQVSLELFKTLAELDRVFIGKALYTATAEGTAEASVSYSRIWGKNALMLYVPPTPSLMTPAACYTFVWQVVANALQYIKRMRDEEREVDIIEGNTYFDQRRVGADAGLYASDVIV